MKNYYKLLGVQPSASPEEIKKAFRHEIARYHPDKVHHLGKEFQELAASRGAELTEAYRILMDERLRVEYDEELRAGGVEAPAPARPAAARPSPTPSAAGVEEPPTGAQQPAAEPAEQPGASFQQERIVRDEVVRKAAMSRFREAVELALGGIEELPARGFDAAFLSKPRRLLRLRKGGPPVRVCGRFVSRVDAAAVQETWPMAAKFGDGDGSLCVFLMGPGLAPARELATAIAEQRRKGRRGAPRSIVLVPVDVRDWEALVPADAPPAVKAILDQLRANR